MVEYVYTVVEVCWPEYTLLRTGESLYVAILKARIVLWGWLGRNQSGRPAKSYYAFYQLGRLDWSGVEHQAAGSREGRGGTLSGCSPPPSSLTSPGWRGEKYFISGEIFLFTRDRQTDRQ